MGTDNFHAKRKKDREIKKRTEKRAVLIATEDTKSSKYYFEALIKDKGLSGEVMFAKHLGSNPKNVLKAVIEHQTNTQYEKKWIVIDRDDFTDFKDTIDEAQKKDICVAFSNESYELWVLLHFEFVSSFIKRDDLNHKLNKIFQEKFKKRYDKSSKDIYQLIIGYQQIAIKNAQKLKDKHLRDYGKIDIDKNPITTIYQLVECLNSLNEKNKKYKCFPTFKE
jgi:hypothetical protein